MTDPWPEPERAPDPQLPRSGTMTTRILTGLVTLATIAVFVEIFAWIWAGEVRWAWSALATGVLVLVLTDKKGDQPR